MDRKQTAIALSGMVAALVLTVGSAEARTIELRNDTLADNAEANAVCGFVVGEKFAAKFTPPAYPATLKKVRVLLTNVGLDTQQCSKVAVSSQIVLPIEVFKVADQVPGTSLGVVDSYTFSNETVLNEAPMTSIDTTIQDGSYLIAFTLDDDRASPLVDKSTPVPGANYIHGDIGQGAGWYGFEQLGASAPKGNWVVRIEVEVPGEDDAGAGDGGELPDSGAAGSAGAAGAAGASGQAGSAGSDAGVDAAAGAPDEPVEASGGGCATCRRAPFQGLMLLAGAAAIVAAMRRRRTAGL